MAKAPSLPALKKKAQTLANRYARLRDAPDGGKCISCGQWFPFEELDGGHFVPTTSGTYRFDEKNINAQCHKDNRFLHGDQARYLVGMEQKYGRQVVDELLASVGSLKKWTRPELEDIIQDYKDKINGL